MKEPSSRSLPLRLLLTVPFVALVLGLAVTIGFLSYLAGSRAVSTVAEHLLRETVGRIGQAVDRHIVGSGATLEAAFPNGMPAPRDIATDLQNLRTRFWIATSLHIDPNNYVYYGNRAGQAIGLFRHSLDQGELRIKFKPDEMRTRYRFTGIDGKPVFHSRETKLFDPRQRPWYKTGETAGTDTWTAVYIDFGTQELVATRARRVLAANGELEGVVATDISLRALNDFVRNLKVSPNGLAFIIEPNGNLIASSASANVKHLPDGSNARLTPEDSGNQRLAAVYREVRERLEATRNPVLPQTLSFTAGDGEVIHAAFDRVKDSAGLEWLTVVAVPRSDFMGGVTRNVVLTMFAGAVAAVLALLIGLRILVSVSGDLQRLSQAAKQVGEGRFDTPLAINRRDEIGALAHSFDRMRLSLQTDRLTGLANHETFIRQTDARIARYKLGTGQPFCVLFIDLNGFKQINDRFGHDMGDQVLVEVARRLEHFALPGDLVARYAGDEFVVLLDAVSTPEAIALRVARLEATLAEPLLAPGPQTSVTAGGAVGVARFPDEGGDAATLLKIADRAMYRDKFGRGSTLPG